MAHPRGFLLCQRVGGAGWQVPKHIQKQQIIKHHKRHQRSLNCTKPNETKKQFRRPFKHIQTQYHQISKFIKICKNID